MLYSSFGTFSLLAPSKPKALSPSEKSVTHIAQPNPIYIDVKYRTGELTSMYHAWKEGLKEWRRVYEIEELKHLIMDAAHESEAVHGYVKGKE